MKSFFEKFDLIGGSLNFNYNKNHFKTVVGGFFSIFIMLILSLMIVAFGHDFYKRINPSFIRQTVFPDTAPIYTINNKNFTIAVRFEDNDGTLINKTNVYYIEADYSFNIRNEDSVTFDTKIVKLKLEQCTEDLFLNKENLERGAFQNWLCPVFDNIKFGGSYAGNFVSTISLNYYYCPEGHTNPNTNEACASENEFKIVSQNLVYMNIATQLPFITPGDYENGLKTKVLYNWMALDRRFSKLVYTYFSNYTMSTDYGWILEDIVTETKLMLLKMTPDFIDLNSSKQKNKLGSFWLFSDTDNGTELFKRKYVRIQQLVAEIGGLINFVFTFGGIIILNYNKHDYLNKLSCYYYPNYTKKDKEEDIIREKNFDLKKYKIFGLNKSNNLDINKYIEIKSFNNNIKLAKSKKLSNFDLNEDLSREQLRNNGNKKFEENYFYKNKGKEDTFTLNKFPNSNSKITKIAQSNNEQKCSNIFTIKINEDTTLKNDFNNTNTNLCLVTNKNIDERYDKSKLSKKHFDDFIIQNAKNNGDNLEFENQNYQSNLLFTKEVASSLTKIENNLGITKKIALVYKEHCTNINYIKEVENQSYNLFTYSIIKLFCGCSKRFSLKISNISKIHDCILEELDIRLFIRNRFEGKLIRDSLYDNDYSTSERETTFPSYDEQIGYTEFVKSNKFLKLLI